MGGTFDENGVASQVQEVSVDTCCGTYCIYLKTLENEFRVARIYMSEADAKSKAIAYAKKLCSFFDAQFIDKS